MNDKLKNDKFNIYFRKVDLDKNSVQNPTLVELQNDYMKCNEKLETFKTEYNTRYNELFEAINSEDLDNDIIKSLSSELKEFINSSEENVKNCYLAVIEKQKKFVKNNENTFTDSHINAIQSDTNLKYQQYQKDIIKLKNHQDKLRETVDHYNAMHTYLNDGLLTQNYIFMYVWLAILILLVFFYFIKSLDIELGIINNLLGILTLFVSLYFVYDGIYNYFNYQLLLSQTYELFYSWFLIILLLVSFTVINSLNLKFGLTNNILLLLVLIVSVYFIYSNLNVYLTYN